MAYSQFWTDAFKSLKGAADGIYGNLSNSARQAIFNAGVFDHNIRGYSDLDYQYQKNLELQQQAQGFNAAEAQKDREFQERMANTSIQRQMSDIKAAGLNPWLAVQGGASGAAAPAGSMASSSAASVGAPSRKYTALLNSATSLLNGALGNQAKNATSAMSLVGVLLGALLAA